MAFFHFGMLAVQLTLVLAQSSSAGSSSAALPTAKSFVVPAFPTSVFSSYYVKPGPTQEPQPVLYDPVLNKTYPFNLTNPQSIPAHDTDPIFYPESPVDLTNSVADSLVSAALTEIKAIIASSDPGLGSNCSKCIAALSVGQIVAKLAPTYLPTAIVSLCQTTGWASNATCQSTYEAGSFGAAWTQILAKADLGGVDGRYICASLSSTFCSAPGVTPYNVTFPKPKPANATKPKASGKKVKVLHLSDLHLDPRYQVGAEGNCTAGMCCRPSAPLSNGSYPAIQFPAPLYGYYKCDAPYYLALAALQSIEPLTGLSVNNPPALTLYTGDLVAHDPQNQRSRDYVESIELSIWHMFKSYIGGPVYAALGNHDTNPDNLDAPHALDNNGTLGKQFSWNYDHVSALWKYFGWIDDPAAQEASLHYGAYSIVHPLGLKIITLNTDLYYRNNFYTFVHADDPDFSGMLTFLIQELQKAEDAGQRVWIVGHVLTGWEGMNAMPTPSDVIYRIVERYSPHVIAGLFFGHTHEDQVMIYYSNNGTNQTAGNAIASGWMGPSMTPLTNLNSGFRMYEVDSSSWEVFEAYSFYSDVSSYSSLNGSGPVFQYEYSTRDAYAAAANWSSDAPLNGAFWHKVTEAMEKDHSLVTLFNKYQGKSSVRSPNCTSDACAAAKICYIRSGSTALGRQCPQGFSSVQSPYTGKNF